LQRAIERIGKKRNYPASLKNIEIMADEICDSGKFKAATLAGCIIRVKNSRHVIEVIVE
jgi:hypothetical protein